jgi:thioredoxin reductase
MEARAAAAETPPAASGGSRRPHAAVRTDVCVGCGTCAAACPEPGALRLVGKQAVVDLDLCLGHGQCADACPVGAIVVTTGDSVQRVEVPHLDAHFQTNLAGLYIVGELGGRGLIKNAINEGKIAVEHVVSDLRGKRLRAGIHLSALDVVIVGAGPAGLSAGLQARRSGLSYVVLERGTLADSIRRYPRRKLLLAEPVKVPLYGDLWVADASKESLLKVWESIISSTGLNVLTDHAVECIVPEGDLFRVEAAGAAFTARRVILATGRRGTPRRLGVPGEDLEKVVYDIIEMEAFTGRRALVVGAGDSAVESALGLSNQAGAEVTLSIRSDRVTKAAPRNLAKLDAAIASGRLRLLPRSQVIEIRPDVVVLGTDGPATVIPNDDVIVRIGGEPPYEFLKRLGVRLVRKDIPIAAPGQEARARA